jgi:hypothetical protein
MIARKATDESSPSMKNAMMIGLGTIFGVVDIGLTAYI